MKGLIYLLIGAGLLFSACQSSDKQNEPGRNKLSEAIYAVSEKTGRNNLKELLTEELVRKTFDIPNRTEVKLSTEDYICTYEWEGDPKNESLLLSYRVSLNFGTKKRVDKNGINAIWESQNEGVYKDKHIQPVEGIGDKASWSSLGGGQLRVASGGDLFYLSLDSHKMNLKNVKGTMNDHAWSKEIMIEKSKMLANAIIVKL